MRHRVYLLGTLLLVATAALWAGPATPAAASVAGASGGLPPERPPPTPVRDVVETFFGQDFHDPYRWLETETSERQSWLEAQNAYTHRLLDRLPGRPALLERLKRLNRAAASVSSLEVRAGRVFYLRTAPGGDSRSLCVREGFSGPERVLVDPARLEAQGTHYAIDWFAASFDGRHVAYGLSSGGSEESVLHVVEVSTGRVLRDAIDRTRFANVAWHPDNRSFYYTRTRKLPSSAPDSERFLRMRVHLHRLGRDPEKDPAVFGEGRCEGSLTPEACVYAVHTREDSPWVLATVQPGVLFEYAIWAAPLDKAASSRAPWRKVVSFEAGVTDFAFRGARLYYLTHKRASNFELEHLPLNHPGAPSVVLLPASEAVLLNVAAARDALYVASAEAGLARLVRIPYGDRPAPVRLPFEGSGPNPLFSPMFASGRMEGVTFALQSWVHPLQWLIYEPKAAILRDSGLLEPPDLDLSGYESIETSARSADGAEVPLSIVLKKGLARDGSHPVLLEGYGSYGFNFNATFKPERIAWLEQGGVYAVAHVRGGRERGDDWYKSGIRERKYKGVEDLIACAEQLVREGYTVPGKLAISGTSAGGLLVGGAMIRRPDLFAAVVSNVGAANMLRIDAFAGGAFNVTEFGTTTTPEGLESLVAMDPYLHLREGTPYPAVLVTTGLHDVRVPVWSPAKYAARLQAVSSSPRPVLLRVDFDAGHGAGSTRSQLEALTGDIYAFLLWQSGETGWRPVP